MSIRIVRHKDQANGSFNNGAILENKPIGFPQDGGDLRAYSNLFYWAHAYTSEGSTIGLHPHRGFEIMSYVLTGAIKHYDTKTDRWSDLNTGGLQVIKSGSGISHSEEITKDSSIFQIWLDPKISKSLNKPAEYRDYKSEEFPIEDNTNISIKTIVGLGSDVDLDTEGIEIQEITLKNKYSKPLSTENIYSIYVLNGSLKLNDQLVNKNDFAIITEEVKLSLEGEIDSKIFILSSPKTTSYKTYINS